MISNGDYEEDAYALLFFIMSLRFRGALHDARLALMPLDGLAHYYARIRVRSAA